MGAMIEAGKDWYVAVDEKAEIGTEPIPNLDKPANGVTMKQGPIAGSIFDTIEILVNSAVAESVLLATDFSTTVVRFKGIEELSLEVTSMGQVMKDVASMGEETHTVFALIGQGAVLQCGQPGHLDYLKVTNQVELGGQLMQYQQPKAVPNQDDPLGYGLDFDIPGTWVQGNG